MCDSPNPVNERPAEYKRQQESERKNQSNGM